MIGNISSYLKTGPDHSAINFNLAITRFDDSNITGNLNITQYNVYYGALNVSSQKFLGNINDPDIATKSQVYLNSTILNIFED
jgi:hypothetical protein